MEAHGDRRLAAGDLVDAVGEEPVRVARRAQPHVVDLADPERAELCTDRPREVEPYGAVATLRDGACLRARSDRERDILPHLVVVQPDGRPDGDPDVGRAL